MDLTTIDIEDALAAYLSGYGINAQAMPFDPSIGLPNVCITRVGGQNEDIVIDTHSVHFDVRAATWVEANCAANSLVWYLRSLPENEFSGVPIYGADVSLPYSNPDPSNPTLSRVTVTATISTRSIVPYIPL